MADRSADCAVWETALAVHALGALDEAEEAALQQHLERCPACTARVADLASTAAALAFAAPMAAPDASVRARLLRQAALPLRAQPPRPRWQRALTLPAWGAALAAALLLGSNGAWATVTLRQQVALQRQEARIASLEQRAQEPQSRTLLGSGSTRIIALPGTAAAPAASGELAYHAASQRALLVVHGLPPAPAGHAYQSWLRQSGEWISIGMVVTDPKGDGLMLFPLPATLAPYDGFWLSLEGAAGSVRPTGPRLITARFSA